MINKIKKAFDIFVAVLFVLIMGLTLLIVGSKICGMHLFTVLTGSMEPAYHTGSLILVQPTATSELQKDDVITYMVSETKVLTHRIVEIVPDQEDPNTLRFCTKGDANNAIDPVLVHQKNIIGKPVLSVPLLGYVVNALQNPPGTYIAVGIACLLMVIVYVPDLFAKKKTEEKE